MPDIEKLKQEAEKARQNLILCIHVYIDIAEKNAEYVADTLMEAVAKQIALQAAEKEAEGKFPVYLHLQENGMPNGGVTPVEYTASPKAKADDGWIKWYGGECPIKDDEVVIEVKYRDGKSDEDNDAWGWRWDHSGADFDIIAYRIIKPAADRVRES